MAGEVSLWDAADHFFVLVSCLSVSDEIMPCVSLIFLGLKNFPAHHTVPCKG